MFSLYFHFKGNKRRVEMLFKGQYQDSVITCQNNLIKIWREKKKLVLNSVWLGHYISKVLEHVLWTPYESLSLKFLLQYKRMHLCLQQWQIWRHKAPKKHMGMHGNCKTPCLKKYLSKCLWQFATENSNKAQIKNNLITKATWGSLF